MHRRIPLELCVRYHYLSTEKLYETAGVPLVADNPVDRMLDEVFEEMGKARISQLMLAEKMGSTGKVVSQVFTGTSNPTLNYVRKMWTAIEEIKGEQ